MRRAIFPATISSDGMPDNQVRIRMSTAMRARDGHILLPAGCVLDNYRSCPVMLWSHDVDEPIGRNDELTISADAIDAVTTFAPAGVSSTADRIRGLVKANIVNGVSIGFEFIEAEPIDPARPRAGMRALKWELLETSFCSVPVDTGAGVTARAEGIMSDTELRKRMLVETPEPKLRGLYDVSSLCYVLDQAGYLHSSAVWEADMEQDDSKVPAMLGEALQQLGKTLVAMASEEVSELLAGKGIIEEDEIIVLPADERAYVRAGGTPRVREFRLGLARARLRAGRVLSKGNAAKLDQAAGYLDTAKTRMADAAAAHDKVGAAHEAAATAHGKATTAHEKLGEALAAAKDNPDEAAGQLVTAARHHRALGKHMDAVGASQDDLELAHGDASDACASASRCMGAATRAVKAVADSDTTEIQTSDGTDDSQGAANDRAALEYRRRQMVVLELAGAGA